MTISIPVGVTTSAAYRQRARLRAIVWALIFAGAAFSFWISGPDLSAPVAVIAAINVARTVATYVKVRSEKLSVVS